MNRLRSIGLFRWLLIVMGLSLVIFLVYPRPSGPPERDISEVIRLAESNQLTKIQVIGDRLEVSTVDGETFSSRKESGLSIIELLSDRGIDPVESEIQVEVKGKSTSYRAIVLGLLPLVVIGGLIFWMITRMAQVTTMRKSAARLVGERPDVSFDDIAGVDEAKQELTEIVEFLMRPKKFASLGAKIPRGVLMAGPPGTGKTLISKAVAGEAGVSFFSISGSEFTEMYVGVGASRVRHLFQQARQKTPAIIFIDEIDAVGRHRGSGIGGGHDEREQTLNQILVEMDGFDERANVIVIAATNRPDILDPALLRPGRFDRRVVLDLPDVRGREAILNVHLKGKPVAQGLDIRVVAQQTHGFSGADLANLVNEAAIMAVRNDRNDINLLDMEEAVDRVIAGPARKSKVVSAKEKEIIAYHEAGHALVASSLADADPVQKVTIVSHGAMGGYTRQLPEEERSLWSKNQFEAMIAVMMGGQVAEEMVFGDFTTGSSSDLQKANTVARSMVTEYGMSEG